jgi:arsenical pump membrane protein
MAVRRNRTIEPERFRADSSDAAPRIGHGVVGVAQVLFLVGGSAAAVVPWRRMPGWVGPAALALLAVAINIVPFGAARTAGHDMAGALAFLLLAVPLAVVLDDTGFFSALAAMAGGGRHLRSGLWALAAVVTIVFNLDAAVVLLTPLYVRIAERRGADPIELGFIPALLASLASSVLPVSNLTNLIAAERLDIGTFSFVAHLGLPSLTAIVIGGWVFVRRAQMHGPSRFVNDAVEVDVDSAAALRIGIPIVTWLLLGFTVGERVGIPAWVIAGVALVALMIQRRCLPWRHVPFGAALLAGGLGVLAVAAASHLPIDRILSIRGLPGELATFATAAIGSNAINNLPALLVALPDLAEHQNRVWAVLLGTNLGPTLWVTGALSTLLWQSTMRRLGYSVSARAYARTAARVGIPAMLSAIAVHMLLVVVTR